LNNNNGSLFSTQFTLKELIKSPALLAGIFGGLLVGIVTALLLLFFIIYRMKRRKYEENTYIINGTLRSSKPGAHYTNITNGGHYRSAHNPHVTLLSSSSLSPLANGTSSNSSTSNSGASSATSSAISATTGLLNGATLTSSRLLKYTTTNSLKKATSILNSDTSPNHEGSSYNYAYIKAPTKEFYA
jgi:hypothetical protein